MQRTPGGRAHDERGAGSFQGAKTESGPYQEGSAEEQKAVPGDPGDEAQSEIEDAHHAEPRDQSGHFEAFGGSGRMVFVAQEQDKKRGEEGVCRACRQPTT